MPDMHTPVQGDIDGHLSFAKHTGTYVIGKDGKTINFVNDTKEKSTARIVKLTPP
jgi:hypothetical protein